MRKLLDHAAFLAPVHDRPARVAGQRVAGRMDMSVPGPMVESLPDRAWFPA